MSRDLDIVVTIPKARLATVEAEERRVAEIMRRRQTKGWPDWHFYWDMRLPAHPEKIRRIYFAWNGAVRAYHEVFGYLMPGESGGFAELSGGDAARDAALDANKGAILMQPEIHEIEPIPMAPFRGFRYFGPRPEPGTDQETA